MRDDREIIYDDDIEECIECMFKGNDFSGVLMFAVALNDGDLVERLLAVVEEKEVWIETV